MKSIKDFLTLRTSITTNIVRNIWIVYLLSECLNIWSLGALLYNSLLNANIFGHGFQNLQYLPIFAYFIVHSAGTIARIGIVGIVLKLGDKFLTYKTPD